MLRKIKCPACKAPILTCNDEDIAMYKGEDTIRAQDFKSVFSDWPDPKSGDSMTCPICSENYATAIIDVWEEVRVREREWDR